jgi:hypothetical protein
MHDLPRVRMLIQTRRRVGGESRLVEFLFSMNCVPHRHVVAARGEARIAHAHGGAAKRGALRERRRLQRHLGVGPSNFMDASIGLPLGV